MADTVVAAGVESSEVVETIAAAVGSSEVVESFVVNGDTVSSTVESVSNVLDNSCFAAVPLSFVSPTRVCTFFTHFSEPYPRAFSDANVCKSPAQTL